MKLKEYTWCWNFDALIDELKELAMDENWDYQCNPTGQHPILKSYVRYTFEKLYREGKVMEEGGKSVFNTGLVTENQETIYGLSVKNKKVCDIKWYFLGWRKESDRNLTTFAELPEHANYFDNPSDLIYDTSLDLRANVDHIIDDNIERFPESLRKIDRQMLGTVLDRAIDDAKKRVKRNYKTAIPQYYKGALQLLLPLCLLAKNKADLALVVEKVGNVYRASTCLTLDMAINNARLIARPDDEWLKV